MRRISGDITLPETPKGVSLATDRPRGLPSRYRIEGVIGEGGMGKALGNPAGAREACRVALEPTQSAIVEIRGRLGG